VAAAAGAVAAPPSRRMAACTPPRANSRTRTPAHSVCRVAAHMLFRGGCAGGGDLLMAGATTAFWGLLDCCCRFGTVQNQLDRQGAAEEAITRMPRSGQVWEWLPLFP
jgi:hypothetical protein